MIDCLYTSAYIRKRGEIITEIWNTLKIYCEKKLNHALGDIVSDRDRAIPEILEAIKESRPRIHDIILENLADSIKAMQITYSEDFDRLCFIFDRDRNSFTQNQYAGVLKICEEKKISAYPSNPCFEFWLLLHFNEVHALDAQKLLENKKISNSKNANSYAVHHTKKLMKGYKKGKYNAEMLMELIPLAIANEKKYCEKVPALEYQLGSTVGLLLAEIISA
jgi:hypothetical protein